ncbi:transglycosylase SLT domain-containing protein [Phyllobacterium leguminum]
MNSHFAALAVCSLVLAACTAAELEVQKPAPVALAPEKTAEQPVAPVPEKIAEPVAAPPKQGVDGLIAQYSAAYQVPEPLVRRVVERESKFNPAARNGPYLGLMQIRHDTARAMGYPGPANGLLNAETNLKYGVKYLAGAYLVADRNEAQAVRFYSRGFYYDAKRKGLLEETGLKPQAFSAEPALPAAFTPPAVIPDRPVRIGVTPSSD